MKAIGEQVPRPLREIRPEVPPGLAAVVETALQKEPAKRYLTARDLLRALEAARAGTGDVTQRDAVALPDASRAALSTRALAIAAVVVAIAVAAGGWLLVRRQREAEVARVVTEIRHLVETGELRGGASAAAHRVGRHGSRSRRDRSWERVVPASARARPNLPAPRYPSRVTESRSADWVPLGQSPIETRGTFGAFRWRITKPGFETFEGSGQAQNVIGDVRFTLAPAGTTPEGMVRVPGGAVAGIGRLPDFFIDKFEVTNQAFKRFVDAGGYRNAQYWPEPFIDGRPDGLVGGGHGAVPRHHRAPRPRDVGARHVSGRPGRLAGPGRQLVRGSGVRPVRRQGAADRAPLAHGRRAGHPLG